MSTRYEDSFQTASEESGVPIEYLKATAKQESGIKQINSTSSNAKGVMQIIPKWHPEFDSKRLSDDPDYNIRSGAKYLSELINKTDPDLPYDQRFGQALQRYYGSKSPSANENYARDVLGKVENKQHVPETGPLSKEEADWLAAYDKKQAALNTGPLSKEEADWLAAYDKQHPPQELPDRTIGQIVSDVGTSAEKSVIGAEQGLVGLADIVGQPFGLNPGKAMADRGYDLERMQKELSEQYSPQQKAENKALADANGLADIISAAVKNPSATGAALMESVGSIYAGGVLSKAAKVATGIKGTAALAAGEGSMIAGGAATDIREQAEDKTLTGKGAVSALGAGAMGGALGVLGAKATHALGGIDVDVLMSGGARGAIAREIGEEAATSPSMFKRAVVSALGEGVLEEAPQSAVEQMWKNYATNKPLLEGVENSAVRGGVLGSLMGAGAGLLSSAQTPKPLTDEETDTTETPTSSAAEQLAKAAANQAAREGTPTNVTKEETELSPEEQEVKDKKDIIKSWGIPAKSKLYKDLEGQDFYTPEGMANINAIIERAGSGVYGEKTLAGFKDDAYINHLNSVSTGEITKPKVAVNEEVPTLVPSSIPNEDIIYADGTKSTAGEYYIAQMERHEDPALAEQQTIQALDASKARAAEKEQATEQATEQAASIKKTRKPRTPKAEVASIVEAPISEAIQEKANEADTEVSEAVDDIEASTETKNKYREQVKTGELDLSDPAIRSLDYELKSSDPTTHKLVHALHSEIKAANAETARIAGEAANQLRYEDNAKRVVQEKGKKPEIVEPVDAVKENRLATIAAAAETAESNRASVAPTSATTGHTVASLSKFLSPEMKALVASGKAVIHDTAEDLNKAVPGKHPDNVQGLTTKEGVTHYVANKLTPHTMQRVALHEAGVHAGLRKMVGEKVWADITDQAANNPHPTHEAARKAVPENTPDHLKAEETLAYLVQNSPHMPVVRRLISAIRNWVRTTFGANIKLTESDARHLAIEALRRESKTSERTAREETSYAVTPPNAAPTAQATIDQANARMEAHEKVIAKNPTPKMSRFRRAMYKIQVLHMDDSAAFLGESARQLRNLGVPFRVSRDLLLAVSKSQAWHDTGLAAAAIKLGRLVYNPSILKFTAVASENNLESVDHKIQEIGKLHNMSPADTKTVFNEIMVARRIIEIRAQADKMLKTAEGLSPVLKARYLNKPSNVALVKLAGKMHFTEAETTLIMQDLAKMPEFSAKDGPIDMWNTIRIDAINTLVDTGYWTKEKAEAYIDNAAYTPFYRDMTSDEQNELMDDMQSVSIKGAKGLLGHRKEHGIKGSEREVKDVVENMEQWLASAYSKAIKNHKAIQMVNFMQDYMPEGVITQVSADAKHKDAFYVFRNGVKEYYRTSDPLFTSAFVGMPPTLAFPMLQAAAPYARTLRNLIVLNPLFTVAQLPQDTFTAMYTSGLKNPAALPTEVISEFVKTLRNKSTAAEHLYKYGAVGVLEWSDMAVRRSLELSMGTDGQPKTGIGKVKDKVKRALDTFAMIGDNSIRQAVYNRTIKEMGNTADAEKIAVERAFELINFRKRGTSVGSDMLRQVVPFYGAYMQVQSVALKTLSGTSIAPSERKKALTTLATTTAQVIAMSLIYNALLSGEGDDEYDKLDPTTRDNHLYIFGADKGLSIPLRPDVFLLPHIVATHVFDALGVGKGAENSEMAKQYIYSALIKAVPTISMMPTMIKAPLENLANYDSYTGRPVVGMGMIGRNPAEQWSASTSETSKKVGELTSDLPAALQISPIKMDHFIKGFAGSVGVAMLSLTDAALRHGMGIPSTDLSYREAVRKFPGVSPFVASEKGSRNLSEYYKLQDSSNKAFDSLGSYEGQDDKYEAYLNKHEKLVDPAVRTELSRISKDLSDIRKEEAQIKLIPDSDMSPAEKQAELKSLEEMRQEAVSGIRAIEDYVFSK